MVTNPNDFALLLKLLPGPNRKRLPSVYAYRITHRNPTPVESGCVMTWEVTGGRLPYQIALERKPAGKLRWHCTCADSVYRGEANHRHLCKHVRGLIECTPPVAEKCAA